MKHLLSILLATVFTAFVIKEITRNAYNAHVNRNCNGIYTMIYKNGIAICKSRVQLQGPTQTIQD